MMKKCLFLTAFIAVFMSNLIAMAQSVPTKEEPVNNTVVSQETVKKVEPVNRWILVNIPARSLRIYDNDKCIAMYPVGVGTINTKTPAGFYKIVEKVKNPTWTNPDDLSMVIPAGVDNPLGLRWLGIGGNYGIHGTNRPESVGHYVSNGCIRMVEADVEKVFDKVSVGTPVQIIYNRLVIDKTFDGRIAYYIYPDGYNMQKLTVNFVRQGLDGFGISDFATDDSITKAIELSNGQPNYVAASVNIILDNKKMDFKAVNYQGLIYVPVEKLAKALNEQVVIKDNQIGEKHINVDVYNKNAYIRLTDMADVFDYNYSLNKDFSVVTLIPKKQVNANANKDEKSILNEETQAQQNENKIDSTAFPVKDNENVISEDAVSAKNSIAQVRLEDKAMDKKVKNVVATDSKVKQDKDVKK